LKGGRIIKLGVEKVGMSTMEVHISNALRAKGKIVTVEGGTLALLNPGGRTKQSRIEQALGWPLSNSKIFMSRAIPVEYRERLREELRRFPFWRDDACDSLAYIYDLIKDYRFPRAPEEDRRREADGWAEFRKGEDVKSWIKNGWLYQ
jgi:hypothetical protein